ncbi:hypothetical protein DCAR_0103193 [Daucus carota subsp. sativus]|uniref:Zinc finger CCCH domain-containing protein 18 n=1 Tax=Daucus carota subsp. sativus TaxID=79200 RepID=A0AAF1AHU2_DAUCS|nr:hypothetical protein DCAR_0103193 [Daucus carota subsp. sativus]
MLSSSPKSSKSVQEELVQASKDAEDGLFHLKRARLLRETDVALQGTKSTIEDVMVESLDTPDLQAEPLKDPSYSIGSKCRFRHTDGRWYNGVVIGLEESDEAKVSFLTPTSENMLMCKFFQQQRCRFGSSCRLSHGIDVPIYSLKTYRPTIWDQSMAGSSIWAVADSKAGIWRKAELELWDDKLSLAKVIFLDDGSSLKLGTESISLSAYAQLSDEEDNSSSEHSDYSDYDEDNSEGLGFQENSTLQRGIQTETAVFAKWENHTRGIASKMMASMGYSEGMGLGATGQGIVDPISVRVLPSKQSLDHALESRENGEKNDNTEKKRSRGGKRKRDKKFAAAARAAKEAEEPSPDVFSLINTQLAKHSEALNGGRSGINQQNKSSKKGNNEDRRALVAYTDEVKELRMRIEKLEEMVTRNKKEKVVYEAAMRKLHETRKALERVEAAHASASTALSSEEREKKWLKF